MKSFIASKPASAQLTTRSVAPRLACPRRVVRVTRAQAEPEVGRTVPQDVRERTKPLVALAHDFMDQWIQSTREGPTESVMTTLFPIVDTNVIFKTTHLLGNFEAVGLDGLRDKFTLDQHREGAVRPKRIYMSAVNEDCTSVFCLIECDEIPPAGAGQVATKAAQAPLEALKEGVGAAAETVAKGVRAATEAVGSAAQSAMKGEGRGTYGIVKFETIQEDSKRVISAVIERCQLSQGDTAMLALHLPKLIKNQPRDEVEAKGKNLLQSAAIMHFPSEHIKELSPQGPTINREAAMENMQKWCRAWNSDQDEKTLIDETVDPSSFHMWDSYGALRILHDVRDAGRIEDSMADKLVLDHTHVKNLIQHCKSKGTNKACFVDCALCTIHNIGMSHWCSSISSEEGKPEMRIEGMELFVFNSEGKIMDVWMLRDPMPEEKKVVRDLAPTSMAASRSE